MATEETTQAIFIDTDQLDLMESRFLKRAKMFHDMNPDEDNEAQDCSQQAMQAQADAASV